MVEPRNVGANHNLGWEMINAGARYLLRQALPGAEFVSLEMLRPWTERERLAAQACDVLVLVGNPRYDIGDHEWLYAGVIDQMIETGKPLVDGWAGSSGLLGASIDYNACLLESNPRNQAILSRLSRFALLITRDELAHRINGSHGLNSVFLPCSSWWGPDEVCAESSAGGERLFVSRGLAELESIHHRFADWTTVTTTDSDDDYCRSLGLVTTRVRTATELLALFQSASDVVSCRLHAAVPAARLGCSTALVAFDSRADAASAFGIPWARAELEPRPRRAIAPIDPIPVLRERLGAALQ